MFSKTAPYKMKKRPRDESEIERPRKIPYKCEKMEDDAFDEMIFQFRVLFPNSTTIELKVSEMGNEIPIKQFIDRVKKEYCTVMKQLRNTEAKRRIQWDYNDLHFTDAHSKKIQFKIDLRDFMPNNSWHLLWLHDGSPETDVYEGMWDLTPDTDLLQELPDDYTFETALADLIDNSLQALWSNGKGERRLVSVNIHPNKISIFDSGPGMDGVDGNLVKWGKMGASLHRSMRGKAIGGKPPYLMPFFGMFGYGGPVATMCLGKRAVVSSKTKNCSKVFTLHLEREALVSASHSENCWKTKGGIRDPCKYEEENSPHRSFTKVEIFEPKVKTINIKQLRRKLKDIYFPYIQCDEVSGKTSTPIEFQVNGIDLAGIQGGEVAMTNLHSCHGPDFILQLHFRITLDSSIAAQNQRMLSEANARLKCVYFPKVKGEESIKSVLAELEKDGCGIRESFESFSRVSVRRLGRLLPDARWALLPFMVSKPKKGEKGHLLKRICSRVKCFIDTDSGFNPTPHKTDLAYHHPYTKALKNFGNRAPENEEEVQIETFRDGKKLTLAELEKQYNDWISEMHDRYDEEIDPGMDQPIIVFCSKNKKLGNSSEVLTVHKQIQRKGKYWTAGQNIKILKGACAGCHRSNVYATLEYIYLDGLPGDACGEAWLICRPLGILKDRGCRLLLGNDTNTIDLCDSIVIPIRVIDSEKCMPVEDIEWEKKLEAYDQKLPSSVDLLSDIHCQELEIDGGLPATVQAGDAPPENVVAVIRPKSFSVGNSSPKLEQKCISGDTFTMTIVIKYRISDKSGEFQHVYSASLPHSSHKGLHGLYVLPLRKKLPLIFQNAGFLTFSFSVAEKDLHLERVVQVQASAEVGRWKVVNQKKDELYTASVGTCFKPLSVACYDRYNKRVPFASVPALNIDLLSNGKVLAQVRSKKVDITPDNLTLRIKEIFVKSGELDDIRPNYEATFNISRVDEAFSVNFPCRVIPGTPNKIAVLPPKLKTELVPGQIIEELLFEVFDEYGNHVKKGQIISLRVDGFSVQDGSGVVWGVGTDFMTKVDSNGFVDLSRMLKVSKGYGKDVLLCIISKEKVIFQIKFHTVKRELRSVQKVFRNCEAGSFLENIVFEITDSQGEVDESIHDEEKHGQSHSLTIKSDSVDINDFERYSFHHGRCTIRSIPLPHREGTFFFRAAHSCYPELNLVVEVHVENALREDHDNTYTMSNEECVMPIYSSPDLKTPKKDNSGHKFKFSMMLWSPASATQDLGNETGSPSIFLKEKLAEDLLKSGIAMNDHMSELERLRLRQLEIEKIISKLQASLDCDVVDVPSTCNKVFILKEIESQNESAATVICKVLAAVPNESRPQGIVGVVALLGTVPTIELSRMLAQYLGENQMLAIVCKNYDAAYYLETNTLHKFATKFGITLKGGYHAFCIEDIRPKLRESSSDPQQLLNLESPTLRNGNVPRGFLGYAVDMISIEEDHLQWRTKSGHGLRETLFYRLFGELQVYKDRDSMMAASSCIKDGALSLDGAIIRGNGLISLGHWESRILFPVRSKALSPESSRISQLLTEKKLELCQIKEDIYKESNFCDRANRKFIDTRDKYNLYLSQNGSSSATQQLEAEGTTLACHYKS